MSEHIEVALFRYRITKEPFCIQDVIMKFDWPCAYIFTSYAYTNKITRPWLHFRSNDTRMFVVAVFVQVAVDKVGFVFVGTRLLFRLLLIRLVLFLWGPGCCSGCCWYGWFCFCGDQVVVQVAVDKVGFVFVGSRLLFRLLLIWLVLFLWGPGCCSGCCW